MTVPDYSSLPPSVADGLLRSAQYLAKNVAEEKHFNRLYTSLADKWDRNESLSAAMKLMEGHGVKLSPEEEEYMSSMDPGMMIDTLVTKIPNQSKEEFQHFFLQLQLIVASASRIRCALEEGHTEGVQAALEDAERTGISSYILRMAIVQAGSEVISLKRQHAEWCKDSEQQMAKLVRGQQDFMEAQKRLASAREQLHMQQAVHREKAAKALLNMCNGSRKMTLMSMFKAWQSFTKAEAETSRIYEDYRERIEELDSRLAEYQRKHLSTTRNVLLRKASAQDDELLTEVFRAYRQIVETERFDRENSDAIHGIQQKLESLKDNQSSTAKRLVAKAIFTSDRSLYFVCWQAWRSFSEEYKREKDLEDRVKQTEQRVQAIIKSKASGTRSVLSRIGRSSTTGLKHSTFTSWVAYVREEQAVAEMEEQIATANMSFASFARRNRENAHSAMRRSQLAQQNMDLLCIVHAWRHETRMGAILHQSQNHLNAKRQQLHGVQQMFRNFATQLEQSLKSGQDTDRDFSQAAKPRRKEHREHREHRERRSERDMMDQSFSQSFNQGFNQSFNQSFTSLTDHSLDPIDEKEHRRRDRRERREQQKISKGEHTLSLPDIHGKKSNMPFSPASSRMGFNSSSYGKMGATPKKVDDNIIGPRSRDRSGHPRLSFV